MNLRKVLAVIKNINSVCPVCNGKGLIIENGQSIICEHCNGKGYHTFDELLNDIAEEDEVSYIKKSRRKNKRQNNN